MPSSRGTKERGIRKAVWGRGNWKHPGHTKQLTGECALPSSCLDDDSPSARPHQLQPSPRAALSQARVQKGIRRLVQCGRSGVRADEFAAYGRKARTARYRSPHARTARTPALRAKPEKATKRRTHHVASVHRCDFVQHVRLGAGSLLRRTSPVPGGRQRKRRNAVRAQVA